MSNPHRGEVTLHLCGNDFTLRPSFDAAVEVETQTGKTCRSLFLALANDNDMMLRDRAIILSVGMKHAGEPATFKKVGEMLMEQGPLHTEISAAILAFLKNAILGGMSETGEAKAAETDKT